MNRTAPVRRHDCSETPSINRRKVDFSFSRLQISSRIRGRVLPKPARCCKLAPARLEMTFRRSRFGVSARNRIGRISELVSGLTGTEVPRKGLRVRVSCPPLFSHLPPVGKWLFLLVLHGIEWHATDCPDRSNVVDFLVLSKSRILDDCHSTPRRTQDVFAKPQSARALGWSGSSPKSGWRSIEVVRIGRQWRDPPPPIAARDCVPESIPSTSLVARSHPPHPISPPCSCLGNNPA